MSFSPAFSKMRGDSAKTKTRTQDLDVDFYSIRGNEDNSLYLDDIETPIAPMTSILDVILPNEKLSEQLKELHASKTHLINLVDKAVSGAGKTVTSDVLDGMDSSTIRPSSSLSSIPGSGRNFYVPAATASPILASVPEDKPLSSPSKISLEVRFAFPSNFNRKYHSIS